MNLDKDNLDALLRRVENAQGRDRDLDFAIYCALEPVNYDEISETFFDPVTLEEQPPPPSYSSSIDAAIFLVQKTLPGWYMMIDGSLMTSCEISLTDSRTPSREVREDVDRFFARAPTIPLALIAALLRSLIAKGRA